MKIKIEWPGIVGVFLMALLIGSSFTSGFAEQKEQIIKITAKKFEYSPKEILLKKGVPVVFEITALDRLHGFNCPDLGVRANLLPGEITRIRVVPQKAGSFVFRCDIFCGDGHEDMTGTITVSE